VLVLQDGYSPIFTPDACATPIPLALLLAAFPAASCKPHMPGKLSAAARTIGVLCSGHHWSVLTSGQLACSWSESGESYSLGTKGLIAWAGLVVVLLGVGINLIVSTSNL
jgi:hypothetical protein